MNDKKKNKKTKVVLPTRRVEQLKGFEGVLDLVGKNKEYVAPKEPKQGEDYELFDFLEKETERLKKLEKLHSTKLKTQKDYPQLAGLIEEQQQQIERTRNEIIQLVSSEKSHFFKYLALEFNRVFSAK